MSEVEKIIEYIKKEYGNYDNYVRDLLDLYQKEKEKNKELWKAYLDVSNDRDNNYIEKYKVKELFYKKRGIVEREELKELLEENNEK